ncbi:MAG TPA: choice-of-anchor P family protein [Frankiaceae bacterium]|nr:choice-of-anchor P family protein [Frankiaceae bacterium]
MSGVLTMCMAIVATSYVWAPSRADALVVGGPIILMGIDAEDGGPGGHGPISVYQSVTSSMLGNASKGSGILVLGGGKSATDNVTTFWNTIAAGLGQPVAFANGTAVGTALFTTYELVVVVSDQGNTPSGGLTAAENNALATRDQDFADHVNAGGGLFGFSQTGLAAPWYPYLDTIGSFVVQSGGGTDITPTSAGTAVGIDDSLDVCCWHDDYVSFPSFLEPLALYAGTTDIAAIGGQRAVVLRACTSSEATVSVTRPAAGTFYVNDVAGGSSGSAMAGVSGPTLTVDVGTTGTVSSVNVDVDGAVAGSDDAAPFNVVVPVPPAPGVHTIRAIAFHATLPCVARVVVSFLVSVPEVAARALGLSAVLDVPTDPVVTLGGVAVNGNGSPSPVTVFDGVLPPVVDHATVIRDSADGSVTSTSLAVQAESKITGLSLLGGLITADAVRSKATATYDPATNVLTLDDSGSQLVGLKVNGTSVLDVTGRSQSIVIPGVGVLAVNEVVKTSAGSRGEITVNALHLYLDPGFAATEVVVASAYAAVNYVPAA